MSPDALVASALDKVAEEGVDPVAPAGPVTTRTWPAILLAETDRGQQLDAALPELLAQPRRLETSVADDHTNRAFCQALSRGKPLPIARCQLDLAQHREPADESLDTPHAER